MFVETRTTPAEVITEAWTEVDHMLNAVLSSVVTKRRHSTYTTKTLIKQELTRTVGALSLARRIGDGNVPDHIQAKLDKAYAEVSAL